MTASHTTLTCVQARCMRVCLVGDTAPPGFGGVRPAVVLPMEAVCAIGAVGPRPEQPPATAGFLFKLIYKAKLCASFGGFQNAVLTYFEENSVHVLHKCFIARNLA